MRHVPGCKQTVRVRANPWLRPVTINQGVIPVLRQLGLTSFDSSTKITAEITFLTLCRLPKIQHTLTWFVLLASHPASSKSLLKHIRHGSGGISLQPSQHPFLIVLILHYGEKRCFA